MLTDIHRANLQFPDILTIPENRSLQFPGLKLSLKKSSEYALPDARQFCPQPHVRLGMKLTYAALADIKHLTYLPESQVLVIVKHDDHLFVLGKFIDCFYYDLADLFPLDDYVRIEARRGFYVILYGHVVAVVSGIPHVVQ